MKWLLRNAPFSRDRARVEGVMDAEEARRLVAARPWWYHRFEIYPGVITPGVYDPSGILGKLDLPQDLTGVRILELGTADGYFAKALSDRGADVTAVDYDDKDFFGFGTMERLSGRTFKYIKANVLSLGELGLAPFDIVLCLGVLYHLPDMMRALFTIRGLVKNLLILETLVSREHEDEPRARYLPAASLNGDLTNFWAPNVSCCRHMLTDCGFTVRDTWVGDTRALFHCGLATGADATMKVDVAYGIVPISRVIRPGGALVR
jgi:tRNA (mo5U34)-methyltransferase